MDSPVLLIAQTIRKVKKMPRRTTRVKNDLTSAEPRKTKRARIKKVSFEKSEGAKQVDQMYLEYMRELKSLPYKEYLQTQYWVEFRTNALKYYGKRCMACGSSDSRLNVHHTTYKNKGQETLSDVIVLCEHCHKSIHDSINQRKASREKAIEARETPFAL